MSYTHWVVPSRKNGFHPHLLRPLGLLLCLAVVAFIPPIYNLLAAQKIQVLGYSTNISIRSLSDTTNDYRHKNGLSSLALNDALNSAALAKAQDMFRDNYWAHISPDGTTPWSFIESSGYKYGVAGENLAKGFTQASEVIEAWANSPSHRNNLLNSGFSDVGYAVVDGEFNDEGTTLVVAMYAAPMRPGVAVATSLPTENTGWSPIEAYRRLNWGQKATVIVISALVLLLVMKHTLVWREQRRGFKHIWLRSHPLGQAAMLIVALILTIGTGAGAIL